MKDHNDSTRLWPEESFLNVLSCTLQNKKISGGSFHSERMEVGDT